MKAVQLVFACVLLQQATASHILHGDDGLSIDLSQEEFCTDVSQYSPKYYEDVVETCCTTVYEPNCQKKTKNVCMDVTNTICKPFAKPNYVITPVMNPGQGGPGGDGVPGNKDGNIGNPGPGSGGAAPNTQCDLATDKVDMNECKPSDVVFKTIVKVPHCEPKKSLNCETGWKVVDGEKVWSGEEECSEVTWQECTLIDSEVPFPAVESICGPLPAEDFVSPVNNTVNVPVSIPKFDIVQGTKCEPVVSNVCVQVPYDDCSNPIRKEQCKNFNVRKPKQDFIHKKKCLLPQDIERLTGGQ